MGGHGRRCSLLTQGLQLGLSLWHGFLRCAEGLRLEISRRRLPNRAKSHVKMRLGRRETHAFGGIETHWPVIRRSSAQVAVLMVVRKIVATLIAARRRIVEGLLLIAQAILSWLLAFGVVNRYNRAVAVIGDFLYRITEPALRPIRSFLPNFGGVDISPIILILLLLFFERFIFYFLF